MGPCASDIIPSRRNVSDRPKDSGNIRRCVMVQSQQMENSSVIVLPLDGSAVVGATSVIKTCE